MARCDSPKLEMMLYETTGTGTQDVRAFRYYYNQQLFAFDTVILVHDTTWTEARFCLSFCYDD